MPLVTVRVPICDILGRTPLSEGSFFTFPALGYQEKPTFSNHEALSKVIWGNAVS